MNSSTQQFKRSKARAPNGSQILAVGNPLKITTILGKQPDAVSLHAEMRDRLLAIEAALARLPGTEAGIGHNNPPEAIEDAPLDAGERRELKQAIDVLKEQPVEPSDNGAVAGAAVARLKAITEKASGWIARQADTFVSEAVKEAGKEMGKWAPRAFWIYLIDKLFGLTDIATKWLHTIHSPF
jgi:hypothetical protein